MEHSQQHFRRLTQRDCMEHDKGETPETPDCQAACTMQTAARTMFPRLQMLTLMLSLEQPCLRSIKVCRSGGHSYYPCTCTSLCCNVQTMFARQAHWAACKPVAAGPNARFFGIFLFLWRGFLAIFFTKCMR